MQYKKQVIGGLLGLLIIQGDVALANTEEHSTLSQGYVSGKSFGIKAITFEAIDGDAVVEGDIVLGPAKNFSLSQASFADAVGIPSLGGSRWPNAIMPYEIDPAMPESNRASILAAIEHWQQHTSIRFIAINDANRSSFADYVYFKPHADTVCSSNVGKMGGKQIINLAARCSTGSTVHEIGHALGLWHEQSRADRDQYIHIAWEHIKLEKQYNFNQHINDGEDIGDYDYGSIMHYGPTAFSMDGEQTIFPLDPNAKIGQRNGLSEKDIAAIEWMYAEEKQ